MKFKLMITCRRDSPNLNRLERVSNSNNTSARQLRIKKSRHTINPLRFATTTHRRHRRVAQTTRLILICIASTGAVARQFALQRLDCRRRPLLWPPWKWSTEGLRPDERRSDASAVYLREGADGPEDVMVEMFGSVGLNVDCGGCKSKADLLLTCLD